MNPFVVDPEWGWWITFYFFLGGLSAGSYFVATNVFLDLNSEVFSSVSAGEQITNVNGETFTMYINTYADIAGQPKPAGPVTIYGVIGQYDTTDPRSDSPSTNGMT